VRHSGIRVPSTFGLSSARGKEGQRLLWPLVAWRDIGTLIKEATGTTGRIT
jgi:hypothetical protein